MVWFNDNWPVAMLVAWLMWDGLTKTLAIGRLERALRKCGGECERCGFPGKASADGAYTYWVVPAAGGEVRVFSRALTDEEVLSEYQAWASDKTCTK